MTDGDVRIKRVYETRVTTDGFRVLVDRLWPRGLTHAEARLDDWLEDVGPSTPLRRWFGHDPARFAEFAERYRAELTTSEAFGQLKELVAEHPRVTLVYSAKDTEHNQAVVLRDLLEGREP